jgi:hypothetical protein
MNYRGARFALRLTTERNKWRVVVYGEEHVVIERAVTGDRGQAESTARRLIDRLLVERLPGEAGG